jgi:hypothetical protein
VIDPDSDDTCTAATSNMKDAFLHELACALYDDSVFAIILTPNYNADHRNHFHVDLTDGSHFLGATDPGMYGLDPVRALGDE